MIGCNRKCWRVVYAPQSNHYHMDVVRVVSGRRLLGVGDVGDVLRLPFLK